MYIYIFCCCFSPVPSRIVQIYLLLQDLSFLLSEVSGHCPCYLVPNTLPNLSSTRMKPGLEPQLHWCPDLKDVIPPSFGLKLSIMLWDMDLASPPAILGDAARKFRAMMPCGQMLNYERLQMGGEEMTDMNEIRIPVSTFSLPSILVTEHLFPREAVAALCYTTLYLLSLLTSISPFSLTLIGLYSQ